MEDEQQDAAAIRIQSSYRGWRARVAEGRAISRQQGFSRLRPRGVTEVQVSAAGGRID
eukprot:COSAG02_NODE_5259_length_4489_cov_64.824601_2_plen_58_part_00